MIIGKTSLLSITNLIKSRLHCISPGDSSILVMLEMNKGRVLFESEVERIHSLIILY